MTPTVRTMTRADLDLALDWAAAEGWNPGLADAAAFHAADPDGFLIAEMDGAPAASLSIVRFGRGAGFLGLYICAPAFRGHGVGYTLWQAGMERLAPETLGLDGVPAQQANYARSGFELPHRSHRFSGRLAADRPDHTEPLAHGDLAAVLALELGVTGFDRAGFMADWLLGDPSRQARVLRHDGEIAALGVIRACLSGHKIGPLFAADRDAAERMLDALGRIAAGAPVSIDVPEPNAPAMSMVVARGLTSDFQTARMWRGPAPAQDIARTFGVATFELG
ncbi:hypothetical protein SAMN05444413_11583 [Roseivivax marinus]|uniref:GNAT family N-acetyltransferase n=1 Tax=Roseivivax marinus TaxID=1379903 RepID=UPI0008CC59FE|nr:GNAT family N-acetyltransferase [Roseivivax marinus]SEL76023.1 hypothetical protein SAMN05444413_11583 [Roseivivax marinus]